MFPIITRFRVGPGVAAEVSQAVRWRAATKATHSMIEQAMPRMPSEMAKHRAAIHALM
jgi:hypothetical protein